MGVHEILSRTSTRTGRFSRHSENIPHKHPKKRIRPPGAQKALGGSSSQTSLMDITSRYEPNLFLDEFSQEEFSDDSINVSCVLTWNLAHAGRLRLDFHGELLFDSDNSPMPLERIHSAIEMVRRLYAC
jgi:hypothetical protein